MTAMTSIGSILKRPAVLVAILVAVVAVAMWVDQAQRAKAPDAGLGSAATGDGLGAPAAGGAEPRIVQSMRANGATDAPPSATAAPGLDMLVAGLEKKVESEPGNVANKVLLAQTYNELGRKDDALKLLREIQSKDAKNERVNLVLAAILSQSSDEKELKESLKLLKNLKPSSIAQDYVLAMYRGDASIRLGDHAGALSAWQKSLAGMPAGDNRRVVIEDQIAKLSTAGADKKAVQ